MTVRRKSPRKTGRNTAAQKQTQVELRERVKELSCLYGIARIVAEPGKSLKNILQEVVEVLPPSWLYPDIASAGISIDGHLFSTPGFTKARFRQTAGIIIKGGKRGTVEVAYSKQKPNLDEGPFLREERNLIDAVARELSLVVERKNLEHEKEEFSDQLRRADRLATMGLLAAGIAHEMNEPLEGILGFAQLIRKNPQLPDSAARDLDKIITASLNAREIVRKMRMLSRQTPLQKSLTNLNRLIDEGLDFLENRCKRLGVKIVRNLARNLPDIIADSTQMNQVLVNLIVNAEQAMPHGGKITITTIRSRNTVSLIVKDTGTGIESQNLKHIFDPFFTLKNPEEGTGLGLAIVNRIVSAHSGKIKVDSKLGIGTRFEVVFPLVVKNKSEKEKRQNAAE
ncbi:MAG: ATP-binding protein [Kiritimatiellae bacterium]|nr:ATP-binding protein [Kiritimatiellia bacterium]MDD5522805.1 ATP-binding protein [Kiritimatiellia bacterium]